MEAYVMIGTLIVLGVLIEGTTGLSLCCAAIPAGLLVYVIKDNWPRFHDWFIGVDRIRAEYQRGYSAGHAAACAGDRLDVILLKESVQRLRRALAAAERKRVLYVQIDGVETIEASSIQVKLK